MTKLFGKKGLTILFICFMLCGVMAATGYAQSQTCYRCNNGSWQLDCTAYGGYSTASPTSYVKRDGTNCNDKCSNNASVCYNNLRPMCHVQTDGHWYAPCTDMGQTYSKGPFVCEPFAAFSSDWKICDTATPYCACNNWNGTTGSGDGNWSGTSIPSIGDCACSDVPYNE